MKIIVVRCYCMQIHLQPLLSTAKGVDEQRVLNFENVLAAKNMVLTRIR